MRILLALLVLAPAAPAHGATLATWARTGGFAGVDDHLRVRTDRVALAGARGGATARMRLSARRYRHLRELLDAAGFERLPARSPAPGAADTFRYAVTYNGRTVRADETHVPRPLRPALAVLGRIFDDVRAHGRPAYRSPQDVALAAARERWRRHGRRSYRFRLRLSCFCPDAGRPHALTVRRGRPSRSDLPVATVPQMFAAIAEALRDPGAGEVRATYDARRGFPRTAWIDRIRSAMDDEIGWTVDRVRPLPR